MNILVLSDTHGSLEAACGAIAARQPDVLLHLGDHYKDVMRLQALYPSLCCHGVRGNCDMPGSPERLLLTLAGKKLLLVHGHRQFVKDGLENLYFTALETGADLVLFGHTHRPYQGEKGGVMLFNPGSIGRGRPPSYGVVTITGGVIRAALFDFEGAEM